LRYKKKKRISEKSQTARTGAGFPAAKRFGHAGRSHNIKVDNSASERVEEFKYLGTTLTNQNSIHEEIESRLKSGNVCYHSVQNFCLPV